MARVLCKGIEKSYGDVRVVRSLDLEVADGEFLVLVGASGCGKSTTLRMVAGLEAITAGQLYIGDRVVNDVAPRDRDIAMVFQSYALYPHMTVRDNMAFGLTLRGVAKPEIEQRVGVAATMLGLNDLLDRKPAALSGGQRQRVAMGRAVVRQPSVFLFDEPLSNLDAKLRVQMRLEIAKLHKKLGTTILYVTHDQVEAMTLADRIAVMHEGVLQQCDPPQVIYARPANTYVATFIGSPAMNLFAVQRQGTRLVGSGIDMQLDPGEMDRLCGDATELTLGVRPQDWKLAPPSSQPDAAQPDAVLQVDVQEPLGSETFVFGELLGANRDLLAARDVTTQQRAESSVILRLDGGFSATQGPAIALRIDRQRLHAFDAKGVRLNKNSADLKLG
ncbi:MAG: sn-glycerol-3-phosphate ABC transporter ATP-binding protein UgpC [Deltaproteobacteria bacterium]|nr:sn-glycerol-3-phosphate ABC transporter ATP-binding protein UgpC [Deltaproteobacteria bacterium]